MNHFKRFSLILKALLIVSTPGTLWILLEAKELDAQFKTLALIMYIFMFAESLSDLVDAYNEMKA